MHYCAYVFIPNNGDIEELVAQALEPFSEDLIVPPYKVYLDATEIQAMAKHFNVNETDLGTLALRMDEWQRSAGGVDEKGLFVIKTWNPNGKWDWYEIGGRWPSVLRGNTIRANTLLTKPNLRELLPACMLTPDGSWHERETFIAEGWMQWRVERRKTGAWLREVRTTLQRHHNCRVVCVDIHR